MARSLKVMVVGSGGREHALAVRLLESESVGAVLVAPGNGGTTRSPVAGKTLVAVSGEPLAVARQERVDLVVVGPEVPLCAGLADQLAAERIPCFGPSAAAAQLEGSKAFMKSFANRHGLRTARHERVGSLEAALVAIDSFELAPVVKADGLCAGKGVVVAASHEEAREAAREMLGGRFGVAGATLVIEERIDGEEASVHAICDGERFFLLPAAQDHKRIGDGDTGPNTGGMGTYAPAPLIHGELEARVARELIAPAVAGMRAEGNPFVGALFAGIMVRPDGEPVLLEFNVRFGDPETEVLTRVLDGDLGEALLAAAHGRLDPSQLSVSTRHAVCVVLAAAGYPGAPVTGAEIHGLEAAAALEGVRVFHAGTRADGDRTLVAGGRVLAVTGEGSSLQLAHQRAYAAVEQVRFDGQQFRRDIAHRALRRAG